MLRIAFQGLRGRQGPFAGAFVALFIAAALLMACGSLLEAGLRSDPPVERYAGAPIVLAADQRATTGAGTDDEDWVPLFERTRLGTSLVARAEAVRGVRGAIADVGTRAELWGPRGAVAGPGGHATEVHPWATAPLAPYALRSGRAPAADGELVVAADMAARGGLAVGDRVRVVADGPTSAMTVVGVAAPRTPVERRGVLFVGDAASARLAGQRQRVDAVGVLLDPGADRAAVARRLERAVGDRADVRTGAERGAVEDLDSTEAKEAVIAIGGTFGGLALLIAMFVVASTIGLSVAQREREVALLRAVAATPRQVRRMIGWEILLVALVASAAGLVPGALMADALGQALSDHGVAPEDMDVRGGLIPALVAVASVLTAKVAVASAGRRAARVAPTRALQDAATERRLVGPVRVLGGLLALGGGTALVSILLGSGDPATAADAAVGVSAALVLAVILLGPLITRVTALVAAPLLRRNVSASMAVANLRTSPRRFASAMTPLVLTVALTCTMVFVATTREHVAEQQTDERIVADLVLQGGDAGVPASAAADARRVPGVRAAVGVAATTLGPSLGATHRTLQAVSLDPRGLEGVLDLDVRSGSLARLGDGEIALSHHQAEVAHTAVGRQVTVVLGDGHRTRARVAATYDRGLGFGDVVLPRAMTAGHLTAAQADAVLVDVAPGASVEAVAGRLRRLAARHPGLTVGDRSDVVATVDESRAANDWLFRILAAIVFAFTAVAVVNTMAMIAVHRTRELGLLRLIGGTPRQVRAMARWEAAIVTALGVGLGGAIALVTLAPTSSLLGGSLLPYAPPGLLALVLGSAAAVAVLGSQLATRVAMRPRPVDAIGAHE